VLVVATSNEQRELTEAGKRRFCRLVMNPLDVKTQIALIHSRSGVDIGICKILWKAGRMVATEEGNQSLSIQEGIRLVSAAYMLSESADDVRIFLSQWAARSKKGRDFIAGDFQHLINLANAAWSEICRARRENTNACL
jgi:hypothetical protein